MSVYSVVGVCSFCVVYCVACVWVVCKYVQCVEEHVCGMCVHVYIVCMCVVSVYGV